MTNPVGSVFGLPMGCRNPVKIVEDNVPCCGKIDPDATGVLAIALGEATKTVPFITDALKA